MRKTTLLFLLAGILFQTARADRLQNIPAAITQPDGTTIHCLVSGDEFFNYYHDENGYTIIQHPENGYYYYGVREGEIVVPSEIRVGSADPLTAGLAPHARISERLYREKREAFLSPLRTKGMTDAPTTGQVNQITIYISFADDSVYQTPRQNYFDAFSSMETHSLKHYYHEVSYGRLFVDTYHYPESPDTINITYVSEHPRAYFMPYSASNPQGYAEGQRAGREHTLLRKACEFVDSQIPDSIDFDANNDGNIDNVSFVIKGPTAGWSDLLWPHRWSLYTQDARINGLRVRDYLLMLEGSFNVATLCHEFFHVLGAPDLYHYNDTGAPTAVGPWDIMDQSGSHNYMCAFMKYKYGDWMATLPDITTSGTYSVYPLQHPDNNIWKIASPLHPSEYFVLEYRKREGIYEQNIPGEGLNVYRINPDAGRGNAQGPPDEVYIYRPGGTLTAEGALSGAPLGRERFEMHDGTNPGSFLYNNGNGGKGGLSIFNVVMHEDSITFEVAIPELHPPVDLSYSLSDGQVTLDWLNLYTDGFQNYVVYKNGERLATTNMSYYTDTDIQEGVTYEYYVTAFYSGGPDGESDPGNSITFTPKGIMQLPYAEDFESASHGWMILGSTSGFRWGTAELHEMSTPNESLFLAANSFATGYAGNGSDIAITPRINMLEYQSATLAFDYTLKRLMSGDFLQLWVRRSPTDQWVYLAKLGVSGFGAQYIWRSMELDIPAEVFSSQLQIGFQYDDRDDPTYGVGIDNISIQGIRTGVDLSHLEPSVNLFPNPADRQISLHLEGLKGEQLNLRILDLQGRSVYERTLSGGAMNQALDLSLENLRNGVYVLVVQNEYHTFTKKLIKQNP